MVFKNYRKALIKSHVNTTRNNIKDLVRMIDAAIGQNNLATTIICSMLRTFAASFRISVFVNSLFRI